MPSMQHFHQTLKEPSPLQPDRATQGEDDHPRSSVSDTP
jgi:hypothetical protein